uniref:photosystem I assembly protein Ycf4 n=1 Tax=Chattonella marina TaxID=90936 RepID=UPI0021144585|nr:photosystem I assembly protein Ycf4 [Chattonella marina]UTE94870.1 photosystem I assembly protein Ycf4 [Chattonella marina]
MTETSFEISSTQNSLIKKDIITGSKRLSNFWWSGVLLVGGLGFLLSGLSSYLKFNLLPFANPKELVFIPQGIIMAFYGSAALMISFYIFLTILWDVGGGYNEFNKEEKLVRIVRKGFPGKNRNIFLVYPFNNIKSIKLSIKEGLNPRRVILLCTKDQREIPLSPIEQPLPLSEIEEKASELALFLEVKLEGL